MRKVFCDMCGTEIGDLEGNHEVEIDTLITGVYTHTYELCGKCIVKVVELLKGKQ